MYILNRFQRLPDVGIDDVALTPLFSVQKCMSVHDEEQLLLNTLTSFCAKIRFLP